MEAVAIDYSVLENANLKSLPNSGVVKVVLPLIVKLYD